MTVYFAPQYRDPNEEFKYYMLQMAEMMAGKRQESQQQQKMADLAKSLSPTQTPSVNGQSIFTPGGAEALSEGWLGGQPTKTGMIQGAQLSPIQIMQKVLQGGGSPQEAVGMARVIQEKPEKSTRSDIRFYMERGFTPQEAKTLRNDFLGIKPKEPKTEKEIGQELSRWQTIQNKTREVGVLGQFGKIHDQETYDLAQTKIDEFRERLKQKTTEEKKVLMVAPDGKKYGVNKKDVAESKKHGWRLTKE